MWVQHMTISKFRSLRRMIRNQQMICFDMVKFQFVQMSELSMKLNSRKSIVLDLWVITLRCVLDVGLSFRSTLIDSVWTLSWTWDSNEGTWYKSNLALNNYIEQILFANWFNQKTFSAGNFSKHYFHKRAEQIHVDLQGTYSRIKRNFPYFSPLACFQNDLFFPDLILYNCVNIFLLFVTWNMVVT